MFSFARLSILAAACALASCQNGQSGGLKSSGNSPYVSNFGNDGAYNPYPGQPGTMQSGGGRVTPTYSAPPTQPTPPPVQNDPYSFGGSSPTPPSKPATVASSSGSSSKPKPKASSSTGSSKPKPKTTAKSGTKKKSSSSGAYKVTQGDTLYGIARKKGTTVAKIKAANKLSSDVIRPGQALKIP